MSRYNATRDTRPILDAARRWIRSCLIDGESVLGDMPLWRSSTIDELVREFTDKPDESTLGFFDKLQQQMESGSPDAKCLMAEMLWALMLFQSGTTPATKREQVRRVWQWSGRPFNPSEDVFSDASLIGIGHPGIAYNAQRWRELNYLIGLAKDLQARPLAEREAILTNQDRFEDWIEAAPMQGDRQFARIFRYLAFPDFFEPITQTRDRKMLLERLSGMDSTSFANLTNKQLDRAIFDLRKKLESERESDDLDFYASPIIERWKTGSALQKASSVFEDGYQKLRKCFLKTYPGFRSFVSDERYARDERTYKDELVELFRNDVLSKLEDSDWRNAGEAAIGLLTKTLDSEVGPQNIVGWRYQSVLTELSDDQKSEFAHDLADLINENEPIDFRINHFVDRLFAFAKGKAPPAAATTRSITGFYLALSDPTLHFFLKTRELQRAFRHVDPGFSWTPGRLIGRDVLKAEELAKQLFDRLTQEDWGIRDLFDVQSFLWAAMRASGDAVADEIDEDESMMLDKSGPSEPSLNQILFGPPGTGKTYHLHQLLNERYTEAAATVDADAWRAEQIASRIATLTWWEALAAALYEIGDAATVPQLSKHPYVVAVASKKGRGKGVSQTLWATLQSHALEESKTVKLGLRFAPLVFDKLADSVWQLDGAWQDELSDVVKLVDEIKAGPLSTAEAVRRYEFVTFHQSFSYEDFMEGLTPVLDEETGNLRYDVRKGVFLRLCDRARIDPAHQYAMIIDEINRGNVSKVLGELITLIEADKRAGAPHEISLTLPYSGERFSVPANIDFIGTMNTADRSLTGLDIALRRRFNFVEMLPRPDLLEGMIVEGVDIKPMLERINERIEVLLDRDHQIGHAYFMPLKDDNTLEKLSLIFRNQILPLLQEYFFEDWQRIHWVLNDHRKAKGHQFVVETGTDMTALFGSVDELGSDTKHWKLEPDAFNKLESYRGIADAGPAA